MALITKPYTFQNQTTADAGEVNQDFDVLFNEFNGNIDSTNIKAGGVASTNLASGAVTPVKTEGLPYASDVYGSTSAVLGSGSFVATKDGTNANQVNITSGTAYLLQADGTMRRFALAATNFRTATASNTYYLDLQPDGTWWWNTGHSTQANYLTIATVTSDASSNVNVITDTRVFIGSSTTSGTVAVRDSNGDVINNLPRANNLNPNLLFNPSWNLGGTGWTGASSNGYSVIFDKNGNGSMLSATSASSGQSVTSANIPVNPSAQYTISGQMNASGITTGGMNLIVYAYDSSNTSLGSIASIANTSGSGWKKYSATFTTPANADHLVVYCYTQVSSTIGASGAYWKQIKVESGSIVTTFSDDNTLNTVQYKSALPFGAHGQYRVSVFRGQTSAQATSNTNIGTISGSMDFKFNASEWSNNLFYAETMIWSNNASATAYAGVWDVTSNAVVSGSEVSTANTGAINLRSSSFSLTDGHVYRPYIRISNSAYVVYILSMDIISLN